MMNINTIIDNMTMVLMLVAGICTLISVITEFTKEIGFLKRIPTSLQVLILSVIVCMTIFFAYVSYANIKLMWYYIVAVIFASFIIAIITTEGWDYLINIIKRFYRKKIIVDEDEDK